jgi:hypothetical protein
VVGNRDLVAFRGCRLFVVLFVDIVGRTDHLGRRHDNTLQHACAHTELQRHCLKLDTHRQTLTIDYNNTIQLNTSGYDQRNSS